LLTERVTPLPAVNDACMLLPTATLIPAGLEVTLSPLRPVALTVRAAVVTGGAAGLTVRGANADSVPALAKMVSPVDCVTVLVVTVKVAVVSPAGTVTLGGNEATGLLPDSVTAYPPAAAGLVNPIIPKLFEPPVTVFGNIPRLDSVPGGGTGSNVTLTDFEILTIDPVIVTGLFADTAELVAVIVPV
jgi:hypothetical protein